MLLKIFFFSLKFKLILKLIHRDLIVLKSFWESLLTIKKYVFLEGSSIDFNKAFEELIFNFSALSIKTSFKPLL